MVRGTVLRVAVSKGIVQVTPHFPFNLMFLPEIYRLEFTASGKLHSVG